MVRRRRGGPRGRGRGFFAGYPITPATSIYERLLDLMPPTGGIVIQAEDEIASPGLCLGASMAGLRAMTATSGPGISLMSENLAFAIGSEIHVAIADVQRLGPSTGSGTRGADGFISADADLIRAHLERSERQLLGRARPHLSIPCSGDVDSPRACYPVGRAIRL